MNARRTETAECPDEWRRPVSRPGLVDWSDTRTADQIDRDEWARRNTGRAV